MGADASMSALTARACQANSARRTLRPTTSADIARVMEILADGRASLADLGIDQWQNGYPNREMVEDDVARGIGYVVEDGRGRLLATCAIDLGGEPTYDAIDGAWLTTSTSYEPRYAAIHRVAVSRDVLRGGLGRFMFCEAERIARSRGAESVRVDTHSGNVRMRALLESLGYRECGIIFLDNPNEATPERVAFEKLLERAPVGDALTEEACLWGKLAEDASSQEGLAEGECVL